MLKCKDLMLHIRSKIMAISPLGNMALRCSIVEIMTCFMLVSRYLNYRNSSWHSHHSVHFSRQLCLYKLAIHIWKVCLICGSFLILKLPHEKYFYSVVIGNLNINLIFHVNLFISTQSLSDVSVSTIFLVANKVMVSFS